MTTEMERESAGTAQVRSQLGRRFSMDKMTLGPASSPHQLPFE
jgi:hypothetical protein